MRVVKTHEMRKKDKPSKKDLSDCCDEIEVLRAAMARIARAIETNALDEALRIANEER